MSELAGQVALVVGAGEGIGKAVALGLAAKGVRVVVTGSNERALAETVGEIACGAGKARHVAGDLATAVDRAIEVFGGLDIVVAAEGEARAAFDAAKPKIKRPGRFVALGRAAIDGIACDVVEGVSPEEIAARVVALCTKSTVVRSTT